MGVKRKKGLTMMKKALIVTAIVLGAAAGVGLWTAKKMQLFTDDDDTAYQEFEA